MQLHGSDINLASLGEVKSLADLKRLGIFNHLHNEDEANKELFNVIQPPKVIVKKDAEIVKED